MHVARVVLACVVSSGCASATVGGDLFPADEPVPIGPAPRLPDSRAWTGEREPKDDGLWAYTDPGELPSVRDATGALLPLVHTAVDADLRGHIAEVTVTQTFRNDAKDPIEVVYAFPLPENSAVSHMRMVIDGRIVESDIMEREAARATYDEARAAGQTTALLEQERPNVFTQSLANIPAGEDIDVEIHYVQTLTYDAGEYEFVFPMVIGPRYDNGTTPDAVRVSPPVVGEGQRRGDDFTIEVTARTGHPIELWSVPTHDVEVEHDGDDLRVQLQRAEQVPNRDFVLRYGAAGAEPRATMFLGPQDAGGDGHFALVIHPPDLDVDRLVGRREFVFVVDRSGSMSGEPLALAKAAVRLALQHLRPVDTFDVVGFESGTEQLFGSPRPANAENLAKALRFIDGMVAGGGTEMADAVEAALANDVAAGRHRYVLFVTDGYISFEAEISRGARELVRAIAKRGQHARVFGMGIGAAPNDHLIAGISRAGLGAPLRVANREEPSRAVGLFMRWIDHAIVTDLELEIAGSHVRRQHPAHLGDLFASHATVLLGEYGGAPKGSPVVTGKADGKRVEIPVRVVPASERADVLDALWARAAVADLEVEWWTSAAPEVREKITRLGLDHHIVTQFTSLVAVDRSRVVSDGDPRLVVEPTIIPEDVDPHMAGATFLGGTAAEMHYRVEGLSVDSPRFGSTSSSIVAEFIESDETHWQPRARLVVARVDAPKNVRIAPVRKTIRVVRHYLRRCYERSTAFDRASRYKLGFTLVWQSATRVEVGRSHGGPADGEVVACMQTVLERATWPSLRAGTKIDLRLDLSAQ